MKRRAVELALGSAADDDLPGDPTGVAVDSVPVDSGVSEQPTGHAETVAGAENRAAAVLEAEPRDGDAATVGRAGYDLGVGVEGGVAEFDGTDGRYLIMWAAVTDGDRVGRAAGPSLALPADVAARIDDGAELGPVMDDRLGTDGVATRGGAAGALTNGRVDRAEALAAAVSGALGPFVSKLY
ncbi:inosine/xanthosine triphosphatase [Halorubrum trapanicum]